MDKDEIRTERAKLQTLLESYESGKVTHLDEDETGQLRRDTTAERIDSLKGRIADFDRMLAEDWRG